MCCLIGLGLLMLTSPGNDAECLLLRLPLLFTCDEKFGVLGSWALASTAMSPKSDPDWQDLVSANARDKLWEEGARAAAAGFSEAWGAAPNRSGLPSATTSGN